MDEKHICTRKEDFVKRFMKPSDTHSNLTFTFIFFGGKLFRPSIKNITLFGHGQSVLEEIGLNFETRIQDDSEVLDLCF